MLDLPSTRVMAYPKETVVAEKLEALVKLGMVNTRMKDSYDLWKLARHFDFNGDLLCDAIKATFERRQTEIPTDTLLALTEEFSHDAQKAKQWQAFVRKSNLDHDGVTLPFATSSEELRNAPPGERCFYEFTRETVDQLRCEP